ncbi:AI-2E family transporter [Myxococcus sp. K38C18041901]|uniref:AI-2E family transporter n=1 Tax=Myxococcus guangdongensis TaxID=2906760 RepID=UPI0020A74A66|nr:AI-2E family transporter [Myxococcus guangdongensis]MCP3063078.1 AI-2E family transporter [Myxococcus guangdongensis]
MRALALRPGRAYRDTVNGEPGPGGTVAEQEGAKQRSQVTPKTVFTVCFAVLAVLALVVLVVRTRVALTLTGIAALIALALEHGVSRLQRWKVPRALAIALMLTGALTVLATLALLVIPATAAQVDALVVQWPQLWQEVRESRPFRGLNSRLHNLGWIRPLEDATPQLATGTLPSLLMYALGSMVGLVGGALSVFFLVVFMLVFGGGLLKRMLDLPKPEHRLRYVRVMRNVYRATGGYLTGLTLICTFNALLTSAVLAALGVPYFLPLGIMSGFSSMVPYAGPVVAGGFITLLTWATGDMWMALGVMTYFVLYGQLEGNVLAPLVFRRTVHVNPLLILLAVLFCAELGGIVGAVVAVPVAATVQIIIREILLFRQERRIARPEAPPPPSVLT